MHDFIKDKVYTITFPKDRTGMEALDEYIHSMTIQNRADFGSIKKAVFSETTDANEMLLYTFHLIRNDGTQDHLQFSIYENEMHHFRFIPPSGVLTFKRKQDGKNRP